MVFPPAAPLSSVDSPLRSGSSGSAKTSLGQILLTQGLITSEQLARALERQKVTQQRLGEILVDLGYATPESILNALSAQLDVPATHINVYTVDPSATKALPEKVARKHYVFPLLKSSTTLIVAVAGPKDLETFDDLRFASGCRIQTVVAPEEEISAALDRYYGGEWTPEEELSPQDPIVIDRAIAQPAPRNEDAEKSAINLVEGLVARAVRDGASDIHLEPMLDSLRVRLRVDGLFREVTHFATTMAPAIISRIKVLAGLDIAEHRLPQDGRFSATVGEHRLDLRTSTYPGMYGEKVVLRLLDQSALRFQLDRLGMTTSVLQEFRELIRRPEGMLLITGPTGSGKTSTLYAVLAELTETGKNIMTIENPVEYAIPGLTQGQANFKAGFDFARGLRAILRQDPDVIMVGEIRDTETCDTAIEASLTGHLVLSTLHTSSAVSTVTRLLEMEVEPYLLASSVLGIIAQRLVRRICPTCKKRHAAPPGITHMFPGQPPEVLYRGAGCRDCHGSGFRGRFGVFELLRVTEELRELILKRAPESHLLEAARHQGMKPLREDSLARVVEGETTLEEVARVTQVRS